MAYSGPAASAADGIVHVSVFVPVEVTVEVLELSMTVRGRGEEKSVPLIVTDAGLMRTVETVTTGVGRAVATTMVLVRLATPSRVIAVSETGPSGRVVPVGRLHMTD